MKTKFATCTLFFLLFITACSGAVAQPTAIPVNVEGLKTEIAATLIANITETAAAFTPTSAPTETPALPTETLTPGITDTPGITGTPTETICNDMVFISDSTIPDNTEMTPGQEFIKTWKVKNTGACAWTTSYSIISAEYGDEMGGLPTRLTAEILPNTEGEVSIKLKAPTPLGTYKGYWRLADNNGYTIGTILTIIIVVK